MADSFSIVYFYAFDFIKKNGFGCGQGKIILFYENVSVCQDNTLVFVKNFFGHFESLYYYFKIGCINLSSIYHPSIILLINLTRVFIFIHFLLPFFYSATFFPYTKSLLFLKPRMSHNTDPSIKILHLNQKDL